MSSAHPQQPRVWADLDKDGLSVYRMWRGDPVGDDCSDNESDESDFDPGADGDNKRKRAV